MAKFHVINSQIGRNPAWKIAKTKFWSHHVEWNQQADAIMTEPINQSINRTNYHLEQSINQSINQSIKHMIPCYCVVDRMINHHGRSNGDASKSHLYQKMNHFSMKWLRIRDENGQPSYLCDGSIHNAIITVLFPEIFRDLCRSGRKNALHDKSILHEASTVYWIVLCMRRRIARPPLPWDRQCRLGPAHRPGPSSERRAHSSEEMIFSKHRNTQSIQTGRNSIECPPVLRRPHSPPVTRWNSSATTDSAKRSGKITSQKKRHATISRLSFLFPIAEIQLFTRIMADFDNNAMLKFSRW